MPRLRHKKIKIALAVCLIVSCMLLVISSSSAWTTQQLFSRGMPLSSIYSRAQVLEHVSKDKNTQTKEKQNTSANNESSILSKKVVQPPIEVVQVKISNTTTSQSYRAFAQIEGWMETNKMHDDYNYCPRTEPFLGPYKFSENSKNPCWLDEMSKLRCLPFLYLVGFSKCGTTDLFSRLSHHPDFLYPKKKEKHWFDYGRFVENNRFIQNYTNMFDAVASTIQEELNKVGASQKITGDGTPCYAWDSLKWPCYEGNEGMDEPRYTIPDVIYRMNPKSKIIMVLREPASRLYSRMLTWINEPVHPVYRNASPQKFHSFIEQRLAMHRECFKHSSIRQCAYNGTLYKEAMIRLMEGAYSVYIKDWLKVFPRKQILIIKFEDYITDIGQTLKQVYSFLELAPLPDDKIKKISTLKVANKGSYYNVGPMLIQTREMLQEFYIPFNEELSKLLEDSNFTWNYTRTNRS